MNDVMFPEGITKKEFFEELAKAKRLVDHGVQEYFILADTKAFRNNTRLGNTTLADIEEVFGKGYVEFFRFGYETPDGGDKDDPDRYNTYTIRHLTKADRRRLRGGFRFFPTDCWVIDWRNGRNEQMLMPFVQSKTGEITYLADNPSYRVDGVRLREGHRLEDTGNANFYKKAVEDMPDYFDCLFACVQYRHTHIVIPIPADSAKRTFRDRDKDQFGTKRRLVHKVNQHTRKVGGGETDVTDHLRGTSLITIDGVDVSLMTSFEWSKRYLKSALKNGTQNTRDYVLKEEIA